jgi:hypothetical protein
MLEETAGSHPSHVLPVFSDVTECLNPPALCSSSEHVSRRWLSILFSNQTGMTATFDGL